MKKIRLSILVVVLLYTTAFPVLAASNNSLISTTESGIPEFVVENTTGEIGDIVDIKISLINNPGITALQLKVNYSAEDLELISINDNGLFNDAITYSQLNKNPLTISWYSSSSNDETNSGCLAILKFKILENAEDSEISVTYDEENVFDSSFNNVKFNTIFGGVAVSNTTAEHKHNWDEGHISKDATCTSEGVKTYTCMSCGDTYTETISATGHEWDEGHITKNATCTDEGVKTYNCIICGDVHTKTISAIEHNFDSVHIYKSPSCTTVGEKIFRCPHCGELKSEEVKPLGHIYANEFTVDKNATCVENGSKSKHCIMCKASSEVTDIQATGHVNTLTGVINPTYFIDGYTGDVTCSTCNTVISKGNVIPKLELKTPTIKVKGGKKKFVVTYSKVAGASGYQIKYTIAKKTVTKKYSTVKATYRTFKKLKKGIYKVRVRAYVNDDKKIVYSSWSKTKKIKVR